MKKLFKILILGAVAFISVNIISFLVFIYYFTKPPGSIAEYTFPTMTYDELENRIDQGNKIKVKQFAKTAHYEGEVLSYQIYLGNHSDKYHFYLLDSTKEDYKYDYPWISLLSITDSNNQSLLVNYPNRKEHLDKIKIFEEEFIDKLKKAK